MVPLTPLTSENYTSPIFFLVFHSWHRWRLKKHEEKYFKRDTGLIADGVVDTVDIKKLMHQPNFFFSFWLMSPVMPLTFEKTYTSKVIWIKAHLVFSPNTHCSNFDFNVFCIEISILCKFQCFDLTPLTCWHFVYEIMCVDFFFQLDMKQ